MVVALLVILLLTALGWMLKFNDFLSHQMQTGALRWSLKPCLVTGFHEFE